MKKKKLKILCPFCNAPYNAEMEFDLDTSSGCNTCGASMEGNVEIRCSNCNKIVYVKEYEK